MRGKNPTVFTRILYSSQTPMKRPRSIGRSPTAHSLQAVDKLNTCNNTRPPKLTRQQSFEKEDQCNSTSRAGLTRQMPSIMLMLMLVGATAVCRSEKVANGRPRNCAKGGLSTARELASEYFRRAHEWLSVSTECTPRAIQHRAPESHALLLLTRLNQRKRR